MDDRIEAARAVLDNIRARRTTPFTKVKPDPIAEEHVALLLEAANWAPTHRHTEPWRFTLFAGSGRARLAQTLADTYKAVAGDAFTERKLEKALTRPMHTPVVAAVVMQPAEPPAIPEYEEILAVGCAVQNLHLAAQALGIGCAWSTPGYVNHPNIRALLGLRGSAKCFGFLYLGYLEEECQLRSVRKPIEEKIKWVRD